jgi:hypothetical protein
MEKKIGRQTIYIRFRIVKLSKRYALERKDEQYICRYYMDKKLFKAIYGVNMMVLEGYEIHDDWEIFYTKDDLNSKFKLGYCITYNFLQSESEDERFIYSILLMGFQIDKTTELYGVIADIKEQNIFFDDYEDKEENLASEYDYAEDGELFFRFDTTLSPKQVLARLKEIANGSKYLTQIAGKFRDDGIRNKY